MTEFTLLVNLCFTVVEAAPPTYYLRNLNNSIHLAFTTHREVNSPYVCVEDILHCVDTQTEIGTEKFCNLEEIK